ncbi:hypothetical protein EOD39_12910 [Acipenser ruthenus]|uniref:Uncharacterized protein n=1 Tax=Acipenser ruthenus TaxID=7906 RepID=A0A662YPW0_ACIRT|nr:hypothetical protein EOD39_12910 [Acipenser ruthenus]
METKSTCREIHLEIRWLFLSYLSCYHPPNQRAPHRTSRRESTAGGVAPGEAGRRVAAGETAAATRESIAAGGRVPHATKEGASYAASARAPEREPSIARVPSATA